MTVEVPYNSADEPIFIHMPKYQTYHENFNPFYKYVVKHIYSHIEQKTLNDAYTPPDIINFIDKATFFASFTDNAITQT